MPLVAVVAVQVVPRPLLPVQVHGPLLAALHLHITTPTQLLQLLPEEAEAVMLGMRLAAAQLLLLTILALILAPQQ